MLKLISQSGCSSQTSDLRGKEVVNQMKILTPESKQL